jgi:predicted MFS family arabinose efflux permease
LERSTASVRYDRATITVILGFCVLVCGLSLNVVLAELRAELHLSATMTTLHGSTFGIGLLIVGLFGGPLVARVGRKKTVFAGAIFLAGGLLLFAAGHLVAITLCGATAVAFGAATIVMVAPGIIADLHGDNRAAVLGAVNGIPGLFAVPVALILGAVISAGASWRLPFAGIGMATLLAMLATGYRAEFPAISSVPAPADRISTFGLLAQRHDVRRLWLITLLMVLTEFPAGVWCGTFLHDVGGASFGAASSLSCVYGIGMFLSRMMLPYLTKALGDRVRFVGLATIGAGALVLWGADNLVIRACALLVMGIGGGPLYPISLDRLLSVPGVDFASLGAVGALASGLAIVTGPMMFGVIADAVSLRHAALTVPVIALVAATMLRGRSPAPSRWLGRPGVSLAGGTRSAARSCISGRRIRHETDWGDGDPIDVGAR